MPKLLASVCVLFCLVSTSLAADSPAADRPIEEVIDHYVDAAILAAQVKPAEQVDEATFIHRLTLDLTGRIPTPAEIRAYVELNDPRKRVLLTDKLLASPAFVRYQATQFDTMFSTEAKNSNLRDYFVKAIGENRPWDRIFRELLLPDPNDANQKGSAEFLRPRLNDLDRLTADVSVLFFGVNVSCAQCHDHPLVEDWKQEHFFGMKSFLARSFDAGGFLAEREVGLVKFKPAKGAERKARMMFLTGKVIDAPGMREATAEEQKKEKAMMERVKKDKKAPPSPSFSARARLVEAALEPSESAYFPKAIVNRLWHRFLGSGLVNPLDQMHSANEPSHPELLDWLARDIAKNNYDLRRLTRGIVLSKAYSRSSKYDGQMPPAKLFAVAKLRALTPMQLATSLKIATSDPESFEKVKPEEFEKRIEQIENGARGFANFIANPTDDFQIGVNEALLFSNSDKFFKEYLNDQGGTLLGRLKEIKEPAKAVERMVFIVYGRPATAEEKRTLTEYIEKRNDRPTEAYRQVLWALLTSAEFRFNY